MKTHESEEMYLETILLLKVKGAQTRAIDVAQKLNYAKSSVSRAVNLLVKREFITISKDGEINFTAKGNDKAQYIYRRHLVLTKALIAVGVEEKEAERNACLIEHVVSDKAFTAIENYITAKS